MRKKVTGEKGYVSFRSEGDEGETMEFIELSWIEWWKG
jgi:hypothetical protein